MRTDCGYPHILSSCLISSANRFLGPGSVRADSGVVVAWRSSGDDDGCFMVRIDCSEGSDDLLDAVLRSALAKCFFASLTKSSSVSQSIACHLQLFSLQSRLQISGQSIEEAEQDDVSLSVLLGLG